MSSSPAAEAAKARGNDAFTAGDWTTAVEAYTEALQHAPRSPQLYSNRAAAFLKMGTAEARAKVTQDAIHATNLDERWPKGWVRMGDVLVAVEEHDTMPEEGARKCLEGAEEAYENAVGLLQTTQSSSPTQITEVQNKLDAVRAKIAGLCLERSVDSMKAID
ncbi:hypothetical protein B0H19DRAFT_288530 [Mycena capillaripes]|nr:hypothetical protein B0H19DRAFT_288530 [Mycena capillaripes]